MKPTRALAFVAFLLALPLLLSACSNGTTSAAGAPHPLGANWIQNHGTALGRYHCSDCHDLDTFCFRCHFGPQGRRSPPNSAWIHGTTPHDDLKPYEPVCNKCHEIERAIGNGPASCHNCHGGVEAPHPLGTEWLNPASPEFHGSSHLNCSACHDASTFCATCHFGASGSKVPPGVDWQHGTIPHGSQEISAYGAVCIQCHELLQSFGQGPQDCHNCHGPGLPHPTGADWLSPSSPTFHGTQAEANLNYCRRCHGSELAGGISGVSCSTCHFGPSGSKVPQGVQWQHGTIPHNSPALTAVAAVCIECHEVLQGFGQGPVDCHNCHGSGLPHPTGSAWINSASPTFHGTQAQANLNYCTQCHGADLTGGISGVSCSDCHFGPTGSRVPPGTDWQHGSLIHDDLAPFRTVCEKCHDYTRSFRNVPQGCNHCH